MTVSRDLARTGGDSSVDYCLSIERNPLTVREGLEAYRKDTAALQKQIQIVSDRAREDSLKASQALMELASSRQQETESALKITGQAIAFTQQSYESMTRANQETTMRAMEVAQQSAKSVEAVAQQTAKTVEAVTLDSQNTLRQGQISIREGRYTELATLLADWEFVFAQAKNPIVTEFARQKINLLKVPLSSFEAHRASEVERLAIEKAEKEEQKRKRMEESIAQARLNRIASARKVIEESLNKKVVVNFTSKEAYIKSIFCCVLIGSIASYYFYSDTTTLITIGFGGATLYVESYRSNEYFSSLSKKLQCFEYRKKWLNIYLRALQRLRNNSSLTVHKAVKSVIEDDLSIGGELKQSIKTQQVLSKIPDDLVKGEPYETTTKIPPELTFLVDHAENQPIEAFSEL